MAGIAVQLSSDVVNIIETLNDLSRQLKINEYDFAESFSKDAQSIINSLQGLDVARVSVYHLLEAESITASALRHKLNSHVSKLQSEAAAAVSSARDSNNSRLQSLQDQLSMMSEEAATLLKKHEVMALHNDVLLPELNKLQTKYDGQVKSLNEKILERAEMQIALNESLDILKSIDDKIRSMMAEVAILEENMCKRKDEIYNEKEELIQVIDTLKVKTNEQYEENRHLNKELRESQYEATESELALQETCRMIREAENTIEKLKESNETIKVTIQEKIAKKKSIEVKGAEIEEKIKEITNDYAAKKVHGEDIINQLIEEIDLSKDKAKDLHAIHRRVKKEHKEASDVLENQLEALATVRESVDNAKQSLMKESEDGVRLETEKKDLEFRLNQVHENHKVNVQLYKEDIADTREKLLRERKIRQTADEKYNELQTKIHDQLSKQMKVVHTLTASLEKFEQEDKILSDKEKELQENIDRHKSNISTLTKEFDGLQKHLNQRQVQLDEQLTSLEDSIAVLQEEIIDSTEQLTVLEPQSITLEEEYNDITAQYDEAKKNMIDLKNYKISLMETCQRTTKELEKMHIPQEKLRMDTLICRAYARKHLQEQQKYMEDIEKKVNDRESKLKAVLVENEKFEKAISYLESECARFNMYCDTSTDRECSYEAKLHDRHKFLQDKQKENEDNEKFYAMKDKELLASLANLQIDGTEQIHKLSSLSRQFDEEMKQFNSFLKRLAKPTTQHPTS